jgi:DNA-directed RNA polymerase subunit beta'
LVINPKGEIIELPVRSSYKEGLSVLEYFISTHGARKGSTDTALKTASAGYLTRRLVDVSQDVIVREENCKTKKGIEIDRGSGEAYGYAFAERLYSRTALTDIKVGRKTIVKAGEIISKEASALIAESDVPSITARSPITCKTIYGLCSKCYGLDLSRGEQIILGEAVGIVAAQSIGEPGTQLTMRTFHIGGVAGVDITHGLPRVEEVFEARTPKGKAPLAKNDGVVDDIEEKGLSQVVRVRVDEASQTTKKRSGSPDEYLIPAGVTLYVKVGDAIETGQQLCEGPLDIQEIFLYRGLDAVKRYIIDEIQKIYVPEGASIHDKHIEVIVRQMLGRVLVKEPGDTDFTVGEVLDVSQLQSVNAAVKKDGGVPAKSQQLILGITRVALTAESFLSAASFQETSRVLVNAAIENKHDTLMGLKENVIIGKLIPVGTGSRGFPEEKLEALREQLFPQTEEELEDMGESLDTSTGS